MNPDPQAYLAEPLYVGVVDGIEMKMLLLKDEFGNITGGWFEDDGVRRVRRKWEGTVVEVDA